MLLWNVSLTLCLLLLLNQKWNSLITVYHNVTVRKVINWRYIMYIIIHVIFDNGPNNGPLSWIMTIIRAIIKFTMYHYIHNTYLYGNFFLNHAPGTTHLVTFSNDNILIWSAAFKICFVNNQLVLSLTKKNCIKFWRGQKQVCCIIYHNICFFFYLLFICEVSQMLQVFISLHIRIDI